MNIFYEDMNSNLNSDRQGQSSSSNLHRYTMSSNI